MEGKQRPKILALIGLWWNDEQRPFLRVKLGEAGVNHPEELEWPILAEYIEGIYLTNLDEEGRAAFKEMILGQSRTDSRRDALNERAEREGWNEFKLGMELELAGVKDPKKRREIQTKWRAKASQVARAKGAERSGRRDTARKKPDEPTPTPAAARPPVERPGKQTGTTGKGRRVFEVPD